MPSSIKLQPSHYASPSLPVDESRSAADVPLAATGLELGEYLRWLRSSHPEAARAVPDLAAWPVDVVRAKLQALDAFTEFSDKGRGVAWADTTQSRFDVRKSGLTGLLTLLAEASDGSSAREDPGYLFLDVFGGSGFVSEFARRSPLFGGTAINSDPSAMMVSLGYRHQIPSLWQSAQDLFMTLDSSVDAVLFAYGTHHVPPAERGAMFREAFRVLKPGGVLLAHDFDAASSTARWFQEVVDPNTTTGHRHEHFTRRGMESLLEGAGFGDRRVVPLHDGFEFVDTTEDRARVSATTYMIRAYDLAKLENSRRTIDALWQRLQTLFDVTEAPGRGEHELSFQVTIHRNALVGVGRKS